MSQWLFLSFVENEKIPLFFTPNTYWWLGWVNNSGLLSWASVHILGKSTGSSGNTFFHLSLPEILQGTICRVGIVIGIKSIPSLLNDRLPSVSDTSSENLLGSYFIGTRAPHLVGILREEELCGERHTHFVCITLRESPSLSWFHYIYHHHSFTAAHIDMFLASCMSQILLSMLSTFLF